MGELAKEKAAGRRGDRPPVVCPMPIMSGGVNRGKQAALARLPKHQLVMAAAPSIQASAYPTYSRFDPAFIGPNDAGGLLRPCERQIKSALDFGVNLAEDRAA